MQKWVHFFVEKSQEPECLKFVPLEHQYRHVPEVAVDSALECWIRVAMSFGGLSDPLRTFRRTSKDLNI